MSLTSYQTAPPCNDKNFKSSSLENEEWGEKRESNSLVNAISFKIR